MNPFFYDLLVSPRTGEAFLMVDNEKTLKDPVQNKNYSIQEGIPIILDPPVKEAILDKTNLHKDYDTEFNYQDHYQKDSEFFNYFDTPPSKAAIHEHERLHETIVSKIPKSGALLLDVGCGNGWLAKEGIEKGYKVISMDITTVNPLKALKNLPHQNHFALVADVYNLPFKDGQFDCIVASEIMEHVSDPKKFVAILFAKLKPGGRLIITTPYNEHLEYHLCVHCNKPTPKNAHIHSFNENNIKGLIPQDGQWNWMKFANKYLILFRTHILLSFLPFPLWKLVDSICNVFFKKETRLLIELNKKAALQN